MYRFNGADARLDRTLECVVMITEALKGTLSVLYCPIWMLTRANADFEHKYNYSIVGHSGESPETLFVDWNKVRTTSNTNSTLKPLTTIAAAA